LIMRTSLFLLRLAVVGAAARRVLASLPVNVGLFAPVLRPGRGVVPRALRSCSLFKLREPGLFLAGRR
jgi:hypothetical protein